MINYPRAHVWTEKLYQNSRKSTPCFCMERYEFSYNTIEGKHKRQYSHHDEPRVPLAVEHPLQRSLATTPTPFSGSHSQDRQTVNHAYI